MQVPDQTASLQEEILATSKRLEMLQSQLADRTKQIDRWAQVAETEASQAAGLKLHLDDAKRC